jgi:hypothetical protein
MKEPSQLSYSVINKLGMDIGYIRGLVERDDRTGALIALVRLRTYIDTIRAVSSRLIEE